MICVPGYKCIKTFKMTNTFTKLSYHQMNFCFIKTQHSRVWMRQTSISKLELLVYYFRYIQIVLLLLSFIPQIFIQYLLFPRVLHLFWGISIRAELDIAPIPKELTGVKFDDKQGKSTVQLGKLSDYVVKDKTEYLYFQTTWSILFLCIVVDSLLSVKSYSCLKVKKKNDKW